MTSTTSPIGQTFNEAALSPAEESSAEIESFRALHGDRRDAALAFAHRRVQEHHNNEVLPELEYASAALDALLLARAASGLDLDEIANDHVVALEAEVARLERDRARVLRIERVLKVERGIDADGFVNDAFGV